MLVLMRHEGESIRVGEEITITVVSIRKGEVKLGFAAPKIIKILREELYLQDQQAKEMSTDGNSNDPQT